MKKGVGSGSISQRYESGDTDTHQNVTDPQYLVLSLLDERLARVPSRAAGGGGCTFSPLRQPRHR
jgi:hypothetical protein